MNENKDANLSRSNLENYEKFKSLRSFERYKLILTFWDYIVENFTPGRWDPIYEDIFSFLKTNYENEEYNKWMKKNVQPSKLKMLFDNDESTILKNLIVDWFSTTKCTTCNTSNCFFQNTKCNYTCDLLVLANDWNLAKKIVNYIVNQNTGKNYCFRHFLKHNIKVNYLFGVYEKDILQSGIDNYYYWNEYMEFLYMYEDRRNQTKFYENLSENLKTELTYRPFLFKFLLKLELNFFCSLIFNEGLEIFEKAYNKNSELKCIFDSFFHFDDDLNIIQLWEKYEEMHKLRKATKKETEFKNLDKIVQKKILSKKFIDIEEFELFFMLREGGLWGFSVIPLCDQIVKLTDNPLIVLFDKHDRLQWIFCRVWSLITEDHVKKFLKTGKNIKMFFQQIVLLVSWNKINLSFFIPELIEKINPLLFHENVKKFKIFLDTLKKFCNENKIEKIKSLETFQLKCTICFDYFLEPVQLECSHWYCDRCLNEWLKRGPNKNCPTCRRPISD